MPDNKRTSERPADAGGRPRPRVLVFADSYLPGWKAGGPVRSINAIVERLGDEFEFLILTRDRDKGDEAPYPGIERNRWTKAHNAQVYYASPGNQSPRNLHRTVSAACPDLVFLNSTFSRLSIKYLISRRLTRDDIPTLLAPRGEFSPSAYALKGHRKRAYIAFARTTRLFRHVVWQASTDEEKAHIALVIGSSAKIEVATDIPTLSGNAPLAPPSKEPGRVSLAFISNIKPKKNLPFLVDLLGSVRGDITLSVFGPKDESHWAEIQPGIASLPDNVTVDDGGVLDYAGVRRELERCHFFVLPTLGENFGHAMIEALSAGRPVIISDRTPWNAVNDYSAGWAIPLEDRNLWLEALQEAVDCDDATYRQLAANARRFSTEWETTNRTLVDHQRAVFIRSLQRSCSGSL